MLVLSHVLSFMDIKLLIPLLVLAILMTYGITTGAPSEAAFRLKSNMRWFNVGDYVQVSGFTASREGKELASLNGEVGEVTFIPSDKSQLYVKLDNDKMYLVDRANCHLRRSKAKACTGGCIHHH